MWSTTRPHAHSVGVEKMTRGEGFVLLASRDPVLVETVQATAIALQVEVRKAADREELAALWQAARLRLVGVDLAGRVRAMGLGTPACAVLGLGEPGLVRASAELRVPAMELPGDGDQLVEFLASTAMGASRGRVVAVTGASGGLGASSLAVGLGARAASAGQRCVVVELADCGGGLDLLMGIESSRGLRWDALHRADGHLGDVADDLPRVGSLSVLALSRDEVEGPGAQAVAAVMSSLVRSFDLVVVDCGPSALHLIDAAETLVLVGADVRGVAAARMRIGRMTLAGARLVVRRHPGSPLASEDVGRALGMPVAGEVREDRRIPELAAAGLGLVGGSARRFRTDTARLWKQLA